MEWPQRTSKFMTKYECARILGTPAVQSSMNGPAMVELQGLIHLSYCCDSLGSNFSIVIFSNRAYRFNLDTSLFLDVASALVDQNKYHHIVSLHHQLGLQERIGAIGQGRNLLNFIISRECYIFLVKKGKHVMKEILHAENFY
ncbi:hypothetical protein L3X38_018000 [Prunus dulcis]|uniref:Uncharacterized protein n=1 Tax=Prunus dulcis TaxID=3755 RepID=A0AAD4W970_PRUDU|nr:hypothetical protein L3X38_018000 [Prunus dulcis]